jgi:hypothetical protein
MAKEFIPYELALKLKQLGFDEPCLASWNLFTNELNCNGLPSTFQSEYVLQLPTYSQAFRWFRENYSLYSCINTFTEELGNNKPYFIYEIRNPEQFQLSEVYNKYEEAELACLEKLIEIVEQSKSE